MLPGENPAFRRVMRKLPVAIIVLGILLRIVVYLQNNSFIIDEANIARNIYERSFWGLTQPLDYEQYAPPLYLWITKLSTIIGGYSEYAYTFYPLLCGILSLCLLYKLLRHFTDHRSLWYPLLLVATGLIYVRYSVELKQYISDLVICLALILLALRVHVLSAAPARFALLWMVAGTVAVWLSMPSVFILATAILYYTVVAIRARSYGKIGLLALIAGVWLAQFAFYYYTILQPQAESEYLQRFHKDYFLYLLPSNIEQLRFNWNLALYPLENAGGHQALAVIFHSLCIVVAIVYFIRKRAVNGILLVIPLVLLYVAAALHKFTLIPRVTLFALPLILVLMGIGLGRLMALKNKWLNSILVIVCVICFVNFNALKHFVLPIENEEMKKSLDFLVSKNIRGDQLYVRDPAKPAYYFYTDIHPQKAKWGSLRGGKITEWDTDYDVLARSWTDTTAMLYGQEDPAKFNEQQTVLLKYNTELTRFTTVGCHVIIYRKNN
jgi:4-amino-4-deoxy-L-arabinose transferase-like glycosyltransferase